MRLLSLLFIFQFNLWAQVNVSEENLNVAIGIDVVKKLDFKFNKKIQIGDEQKLEIIIVPRKQELTFRGLKPGTTSVIIRDNVGDIRKRYKVTITSTGKSTVVSELRELIGDIEGLSIGIKGGKVVVGGEIFRADDIGKVSVVLDAYPDVLRMIEVSPQAQRYIAKKMQEEFARNNMKEVTVRVVNKTYWIEGVVNSDYKKNQAQTIAEAYLPYSLASLSASSGRIEAPGQQSLILNFVTINKKEQPKPPAKLIKVTAQFVELKKDYLKVFAFSWNPSLTGDSSISFNRTNDGGVTTNEQNTLAGAIGNLFPQLNSAKNAGYARVIQSGMGITVEGKKISINKTRNIRSTVGSGEFQVPVTENVSFTLGTTPKTAAQDSILLEGLSFQVNISGDGGSAPTTNSISTELVVKNKESAVIGGVVQKSTQTQYDKDLPNVTPDEGARTLVNLGRSRKNATDKTQFVMFVTPEVLESASGDTKDIMKKFRKRGR